MLRLRGEASADEPPTKKQFEQTKAQEEKLKEIVKRYSDQLRAWDDDRALMGDRFPGDETFDAYQGAIATVRARLRGEYALFVGFGKKRFGFEEAIFEQAVHAIAAASAYEAIFEAYPEIAQRMSGVKG